MVISPLDNKSSNQYSIMVPERRWVLKKSAMNARRKGLFIPARARQERLFPRGIGDNSRNVYYPGRIIPFNTLAMAHYLLPLAHSNHKFLDETGYCYGERARR